MGVLWVKNVLKGNVFWFDGVAAWGEVGTKAKRMIRSPNPYGILKKKVFNDLAKSHFRAKIVILAGLEAFLEPLGPILEPLGAVLGPLGALLGASKASCEHFRYQNANRLVIQPG